MAKTSGWTFKAIKDRQLKMIGEPLKGDVAKEAGTEAQEAGDEWQKRLDHYHDGLLRRGLVIKVFRQYPKMTAVWEKYHLVYIVDKGEKGPCDYAVIFNTGLAGLFDAKSSVGIKRFTWPEKQEHQLTEMRRLHQMTGGRAPAFALVEWRKHGEVRVHPIFTIEDRTVVREDGLIAQGVNWLPVVLRHWT